MYETDEHGLISVENDTPVSGDPTFKSNDGKKTVLPIGTYIIEETKAPTGYLLPSCQGRTFIEVITYDENAGEANDRYHHETYKPIDTETGTLANGTPYTYTGLKWNLWKLPSEK